jgi:hypothetical protein
MAARGVESTLELPGIELTSARSRHETHPTSLFGCCCKQEHLDALVLGFLTSHANCRYN